mmetsp:Transcript_61121/g.172296  ORF Transcript_61121/g.172296 Transcript_61121/m.172296 type:complete len:204 (-) Transcript_61121:212-823(-)
MGFGDKGAKDKKKDAASAADTAKQQAAEDAAWEDNDKKNSGKAARAKEKESAEDAKLQAKLEKKALEAEEEAAASKLKGANKVAPKLTQAQIAQRQALLASAKPAPKKSSKSVTVAQPKLEENTNRAEDTVDASGIDNALAALGGGDADGGKASKMSYKEYEEKVIPGIKEDNPGLKMSQVKDHARKMWDRAPENPKNQEAKA